MAPAHGCVPVLFHVTFQNSQNHLETTQIEPFIAPCLVLLDFIQVFVKSLKLFAQTLQKHIKSHTQKLCAGAHSRQRLGTKIIFGSCLKGPRGPN